MLKKRRQNRQSKEPWENVLLIVVVGLFVLFMLNLVVRQCTSKAHAEPVAPSDRAAVVDEPWNSEDWVDPMGQSVQPRECPAFPNDEQLTLIGRIASGVANWKRAQGGWWYCGEWIDEEPELTDLALSLAYNLVRAAAQVSENPEKVEDAFVLNVWGMAGTVMNESRFDACALGLNPRKWAYREGVLVPRKECISHTKDEVLSVVHNDDAETYFKRSGYDLGFCQILTRFYREVPPSEIMTAKRGMDLCAREMKIRAMRHKTDRPWLYWRGSATPWYDVKIKRWARRLGARATEI